MSKKNSGTLTLEDALKIRRKKQLEKVTGMPLHEVFKGQLIQLKPPIPQHKLVMFVEVLRTVKKWNEMQSKWYTETSRINTQVKIYASTCRICELDAKLHKEIEKLYNEGYSANEIVNIMNQAPITPLYLGQHIGAGHLNEEWRERDKGWVYYYLHTDDDKGITYNIYVHHSDEADGFFVHRKDGEPEENEETEEKPENGWDE